MWNPVLFLLTILTTVSFSNAYRILIVAPTNSKSHAILSEGLVKHLIEAGHEITYIPAIPPDKPLPRVTVIDVSDIVSPHPDEFLNVKDFMDRKFDLDVATGFIPYILAFSEQLLDHPNVQKFMADKSQQFDLVIVEFLFNTIHAGFSGLYNCPLIWFSPTHPNWMVFELIDEATNPAYSVGRLSSNVPPLNFKERVLELGNFIMEKLIQMVWISKSDKELYEKNFVPLIRERRTSVPSLETLAYNGSLVFSNYHQSLSVGVRAPPNHISIGGFHIDQNVKPLSQDLQELMDDATDGVIYISLGSNIKSKHFPSEVKRDILEMFGKLKQTVIWKFEEDLPNRPSNVHILKWAPQQSILSHKNCIIFITHGGLLSTTESIHFGVPVIGVPAFYDQFLNVERAVKMGYGRKVDLSYKIATGLDLAIQEVLDEPKYTAKVHELSEIYHDRPVPPGKDVVYWVEHVIKTRGAPHLRSPAFLTPWYQKLYLDFALVLLILVLVLKFAFRHKFKKNDLCNERNQK
ncbi:jg14577 [Pararge aegeria aegeria]|uniref:Jg14577 protein n=1 Tax=Pararge aegeria aegeria TaxID=348720 RepID=A0A8S4QZP7_9NEOP|nr:jg14577 [Pararge aegeria aegeria]